MPERTSATTATRSNKGRRQNEANSHRAANVDSRARTTRHRRIAGEGADDRQVSWQRLHGQGLDGPRPRPAEEHARRRRRRRLRAEVSRAARQDRRSSRSSRRASKARERVFLATDPDREGEAIAWHLVQATGARSKPVHRVVFHEITPEAVTEAMEQSARDRHGSGRCAAGAARARPAGRLRRQPAALEEGQARVCRPAACRRRRCGSWSSASGRF